jgi:hypothetical protein
MACKAVHAPLQYCPEGWKMNSKLYFPIADEKPVREFGATSQNRVS